MEARLVLDRAGVDGAVAQLAKQLGQRCAAPDQVLLVGVQQGGVHLAGRLAELIEKATEQAPRVGTLDVSMHRDDLHQRATPVVYPTAFPVDVSQRTVVLVDDVICSGRTVRAAIDAILHFGRPRRIELAVLVDRGHRELPIQPDYTGSVLKTKPEERVNVVTAGADRAEGVYIESP